MIKLYKTLDAEKYCNPEQICYDRKVSDDSLGMREECTLLTELFLRIPEEKRERILQAAISEFSSRGYESANTNTIAQAAGISVGSLYKYFENKEDLFLTTVNYGAAVLKATLDEIIQGEEDILLKVEKVLRTIQKHSRESAGLIRLYNEMSTYSDSALVRQAVESIETQTARLYKELVVKAQEEHEARTDCDPGMLAFLIDNLFMMLQYSYATEYYRCRFKLFAGNDIFERDDFVVKETLKFIKAAFDKNRT
jgi:AcrR family transcriptional regulator